MQTKIIITFCSLLTWPFINAQVPVSQIEGYLEVFHPLDSTSLYLGKGVARNIFSGKRSNTMVGYKAGYNDSTGLANSFFGRGAGYSNKMGEYNSFFGRAAGYLADGSYNSFFGLSAGFAALGSYNSFFGRDAGYHILGDSCIAIGNTAGPSSSPDTISNRLYIDVKQTDDPLIYGEFDNDLIRINGTFQLGATDYFKGDEGLIKAPEDTGADLFLVANDGIILEIGDYATNSGHFEVWNGPTNDVLLILTENGNLTIDGTLSEGSDRDRKHHVSPINSTEILTKLMELPISQWQYTGDDAWHIGPMAQDFYAAFGLGQGETTIASVDKDGIAMAAIQALADRNIELGQSLSDLKKENANLKARIDALTERMEHLEKQVIKK